MTRFFSFPLSLLAAVLVLSIGWMGLADSASAQDRGDEVPRLSPNAAVTQTIGITEVHVTYGRPSMRDRDIFGGLVPYGEVWRTGADEATTISFEHDVLIEGEPLDAGTYALFTVPEPDSWTLIFNEDADQWGAFEHDPEEDALRVDVTPESGVEREMFTILFENVDETSGDIVLHWADVRAPFNVEVDTRAVLRDRNERIESWLDDAGDDE